MAVTAAAAGLMPTVTQGSTDRKPNVIILFIDDLGYGDLACFGNKRTPTPNIDALASEGVRLTMHYVTNPPCSPSRCSLMTGMYAQKFGKFSMNRGQPIPKDHPTIAEFMRDAGYVTGQVGKWDLGDATQGPHKRGFMEVARYNGGESYTCKKPDGGKAYRTIQDGDYLVEFVERNKSKPFFLYYSPLAIHSPHKDVPQEYVEKAGGSQYGGAVVAVDEAVGKVIAVLKKHQLEKNTLVLLTGDNGPGRGGCAAPYTGGKGKGTSKEGWVHVPGIAWWPDTIPAGKDVDGLSATFDYYATAAAVAGKEPPERCDGKNLIPYLTGKEKGDIHEYLYWYNRGPKRAERMHISAVRWKNWRLFRKTGAKNWALYDLVKDPEEAKNLANAHKDIVKQLDSKHKEFISKLPSPDEFPDDYKSIWAEPPGGVGWEIGEGK